MALGHSPQIVRDGLVLHLDAANVKSYPGSGTSLNNIANAGLTSGELINGASYSGDSSGVILLDGTNGRIDVSNSSGSMNLGTGDFTIEVWMYPIGTNSYTHMMAFDDQNNFSFKAVSASRQVYFYGGSSTYRSSTGDFNDWRYTLNSWNQLCLVRSGTLFYGYMNGKLQGTKDLTGVSIKSINFSNLRVGWGWSSEYTQQKRGVSFLYAKSLTEEEIKQNFEAYRDRYGI